MYILVHIDAGNYIMEDRFYFHYMLDILNKRKFRILWGIDNNSPHFHNSQWNNYREGHY